MDIAGRMWRSGMRWGFSLGVWGLAMAASGLVTAAHALPGLTRGALGGHPRVERVQDDSGETRLAVAGRKLSVRGSPKGGAVVAHVESGVQLLIVETQGGLAKVKDYQSGKVLGWVNRALLLNPAE